MKRVLIIDDSESLCQQLQLSLEIEGYDVAYRITAGSGLLAAREGFWGVILLDVMLDGGNSGLDLLKKIKLTHPEQQVVMFSGQSTIDIAVQATRLGAYDFIEKPAEDERLLLTLRNALEKNQLSQMAGQLLSELQDKLNFVGKSAKIMSLVNQVVQLGASDSKVLIQGETGVGKDLLAKAIHYRSQRAKSPFISINCAAIPANLIESELFGHARGAFTGAETAKPGRFEMAQGGTIYLDEIGDLDYASQAKVLRVMQNGEFERLGDNTTIKTSARILAASNKNLADEVKKGLFRKDLYYRLNVITVNIPPLRERKEDIPLLLAHFLDQYCIQDGKTISHFSPEAIELFVDYDWPGNVRQLISIVKRIVVFETKPYVDYATAAMALQMEGNNDSHAESRTLVEAMSNFEKGYIKFTLERTKWDIKSAAGQLGLNETDLNKKIKQFDLSR